MECSKCGAKWDVSKEMESKIKSCPFCGAQISICEKGNITFTEVVPCFKHIFKTYGTDIIANKGKFLGLLSDFFPSGKAEIRLIKIAIDAGVYEKFLSLKENEIEAQKLSAIMLLTDNYFVGKEHAEKVVGWILESLFEGYTAPVSKVEVTTPATKAQPAASTAKPATAKAEKSAKSTSKRIAVHKKIPFLAKKQTVSSSTPTKKKLSFSYGEYEGDIANGRANGYGIMCYSNGDRYEGEWKDNKQHGKGTLYYPNGKIQYEGDFAGGLFNGYGIYYYKSGNRYEGYWKNDKKHGKGTYYFTDVEKYEGEWKDNKQHGQGTLYHNGNIWYQGQWQNGLRHGHGTAYWYERGDILYEGEWQNNKMHGHGTIYQPCSNGCKWYEGEFQRGERNGHGIEYRCDGIRKWYEGEWKNDKLHGFGIEYDVLGKITYQGQWVNGEKAN